MAMLLDTSHILFPSIGAKLRELLLRMEKRKKESWFRQVERKDDADCVIVLMQSYEATH